MSDLRFGIEIGARDKTQSGLKSALASVTGFARGAASALTQFNLGIKPVISGLESIIESGAGLEVVRKGFSNLTGTSGRDIEKMGRELTNAASGTLKLADAMRIANRALGAGMKFNDIKTTLEFVSKKAIATGKDSAQAMDTVITGLARGSTLFLDDFGILVDGVEGVKRTYDQIKGIGAFDHLGPAAQKAETVRQAIGEMAGQMNKLGISGKETIFQYQAIKAEIGNITDRLVLAVTSTQQMRDALMSVRDVLQGSAEFFEGGGKLMQVLTGKGDSGGLVGILKAGAADAGELLGRVAAGNLLLALGNAPELFTKLGEEFAGAVEGMREPLKRAFVEAAHVFATELVPALKKTHSEIVEEVAPKLQPFMEWMDKPFRPPNLLGSEKKATGPLSGLLGSAASSNPMLFAGQAAMMSAIGAGAGDETFPEFLTRKGNAILGGGIMGGGPSRVGAEIAKFRKEFPASVAVPGKAAIALPSLVPDGAEAIGPSEHPFTAAHRAKLLRENARDKHRLKVIERGGEGIKGEVMRDTNAHVRQLRKDGLDISPSDAKRMFKEAFQAAIESAKAPVQARIDQRTEDIAGSDLARNNRNLSRRLGAQGRKQARDARGIARRQRFIEEHSEVRRDPRFAGGMDQPPTIDEAESARRIALTEAFTEVRRDPKYAARGAATVQANNDAAKKVEGGKGSIAGLTTAIEAQVAQMQVLLASLIGENGRIGAAA